MIDRALVVGGGIGGMAAAITLRRLGVGVDLIDLDPQWRVYGAGITITGATLRAFKALGLLEAVVAQAYTGDGIQICTVDGEPLQVVPTPVQADADVPGCGGIMRPLLHQLLSTLTQQLGTQVRLGLTVERIEPGAAGAEGTASAERAERAEVHFSNGERGRYDLVIGADGLNSRVRSLLWPDAPSPQYTGQSVWRLVAPRPASIARRHFFLGGPVKVGLTPVSREHMYLFLLETTPRRPVLGEPALAAELATLLEGYGGVLADIRRGIGPDSSIVLRPLEGFLLPRPWQRGRVILIGDAAHPTTPQLASGAGMAVEDALVLGEEIARDVPLELSFERFMARRYERCRLVVENSLEIGRREQARAPIEQQTRLVEESLRVLAAPI